jgi:hypothetical protein
MTGAKANCEQGSVGANRKEILENMGKKGATRSLPCLFGKG